MSNLHPPLPQRPSPMPGVSCWVLPQWVCLQIIVFQPNPKWSVRSFEWIPKPVSKTLLHLLSGQPSGSFCHRRPRRTCMLRTNVDFPPPMKITLTQQRVHDQEIQGTGHILKSYWSPKLSDMMHYWEEFPPTGISWIDSAPSQLTEPQSTLGLKPL